MSYLLWALAGIVGLYILWKPVRVELGLRLPAKAKGRSYLCVQLGRMGIREQDVPADIVDAAVELAEFGSTDMASGKWNPQIFCEALDGYAQVIQDKLKKAPMDSFDERIWDMIHTRSMQRFFRVGQHVRQLGFIGRGEKTTGAAVWL